MGNGTFGVVMKAQDRTTGETVAVKHITNVFTHCYGFKKVMREIQILRELTKMKGNFFTTKLIEVLVPSNKDFNDIFIVMDFKSSDLKKLFSHSNGPEFSLTESDHLKTILYNIFCSVNFLHTANVAHRDLKPANILIDSDCNITLCDFGIARTIEPQAPSKKHMRSKTVHVASRCYRAPELIVGQTDYTTKVDIWSIGCITAEIL
jgi:serine/threonine protein kinase